MPPPTPTYEPTTTSKSDDYAEPGARLPPNHRRSRPETAAHGHLIDVRPTLPGPTAAADDRSPAYPRRATDHRVEADHDRVPHRHRSPAPSSRRRPARLVHCSDRLGGARDRLVRSSEGPRGTGELRLPSAQ